MRSMTRWFAMAALCLPLTLTVRAEEKPRPPDKWSKGQIKDKYNKAASGKDKDKARDDKRPGRDPVTKTDKWAKNQIKDKYNQAANPKK